MTSRTLTLSVSPCLPPEFTPEANMEYTMTLLNTKVQLNICIKSYDILLPTSINQQRLKLRVGILPYQIVPIEIRPNIRLPQLGKEILHILAPRTTSMIRSQIHPKPRIHPAVPVTKVTARPLAPRLLRRLVHLHREPNPIPPLPPILLCQSRLVQIRTRIQPVPHPRFHLPLNMQVIQPLENRCPTVKIQNAR